jgi:hypothetical protein
VLSYANGLNPLPSANNVSPVRNNFGVRPEEEMIGRIYELVLHEIGIFTFLPIIQKLASDPASQSEYMRRTNLGYVAVETFAEKRKDDLFGRSGKTFLPQWEAEFRWLYDYYTRHDRPGADIEALLRGAVAEYIRVHGEE